MVLSPYAAWVMAPCWEGHTVSTLSHRRRIAEHLRQHPALLERPIEKPMFVFGLPRTGTTLIINWLNADPARRWQTGFTGLKVIG